MTIKKDQTYIIRYGLKNVKAKVERIVEENGRTYVECRTENDMYVNCTAENFKQRADDAAVFALRELEEVTV